jgi:hypothetical protein
MSAQQQKKGLERCAICIAGVVAKLFGSDNRQIEFAGREGGLLENKKHGGPSPIKNNSRVNKGCVDPSLSRCMNDLKSHGGGIHGHDGRTGGCVYIRITQTDKGELESRQPKTNRVILCNRAPPYPD